MKRLVQPAYRDNKKKLSGRDERNHLQLFSVTRLLEVRPGLDESADSTKYIYKYLYSWYFPNAHTVSQKSQGEQQFRLDGIWYVVKQHSDKLSLLLPIYEIQKTASSV